MHYENLQDREIKLVLREHRDRDPVTGYVAEDRLGIVLIATGEEVGYLNFRLEDTESLRLYGGHIGYGVHEQFRGHHYAAKATKLALQIGRDLGWSDLIITCNPDNIASRRTCEWAGGELLEIVDLPEDNNMYQLGERQKCRYRFIITS